MGFGFAPGGLGVLVVITVLAMVGGRLLGIRLRWWRGAVRIPAVHAGLSTSRVLVLELLDGVSARDAGPLLARDGAGRAGLARGLLECMLRQVMIDGVFHADPHPGNVLVLTGGRR